MLNAGDVVADANLPTVIEYADPKVAASMANGRINTDDDVILSNIRSSIRRGHPQMRTGPMRPERVCLVGSGPSLEDTEGELRQLLWEGATLVTLNGGYHWCLERNLQPRTQIVMDARATNARFVQPAVPKCNYVLASQCAPEVWDAVDGRDHVWIFHAVVKAGEGDSSAILNDFYLGNWIGVGGGTTVATRALNLLRTAGYLRFDLFGIDCCWVGTTHHALPQPENDRDTSFMVDYGVSGQPATSRRFRTSATMLKQFEDFLTVIHINGKLFQLTVHGDGLLAYALHTLADQPGEIQKEST